MSNGCISAALWVASAVLVLSTGACGAPSKSIHLEAENGTPAGGVTVSTATPGYSGSGYVTGFTTKESTVTMTFPANAGIYRMAVRYRAPGPKGYDVTINGRASSGMFAASPSFTTATTGLVLLNDGTNTLTIGGGWGWFDIDAVDLTPSKPFDKPKKITSPPVDPKSTPEARKLLSYLESVYGEATVSGQQDISEAEDVRKRIGKMPAIVCTDLIDYSPSRVDHGSKPEGTTEKAIALGKSGTIVGMMWHWNAPMHLIDSADQPWYKGFYTKASTFDVQYAMSHPDSPEYKAIVDNIDTIAVQLAKLDAAHIPVLWRPLHEASGGWFWWGAHGPGPFIDLWHLMYHRLVDVHHLHNLIWVYTDLGDPAWYPGDKYVDIVGTDQYPSDRTDLLTGVWMDLKKRYDGRKMIALAEVKTVPEIGEMQKLGVWWDYFLPWTGNLGPKGMSTEDVERIYGLPTVVSKDGLPKGGF